SRVIDRHAKRHMLAVTNGRHDKDKYCADEPLTADNGAYPTKNTDNSRDEGGYPRKAHREHCNRAAACGSELLWRAARRTNALGCFISFATLCANRHNGSLTRKR